MGAKHSEPARLENGRPGMSFRQVLVPGILMRGLNRGFDRLEEMRRHSDMETLRFVNRKIIELGRKLVKPSRSAAMVNPVSAWLRPG